MNEIHAREIDQFDKSGFRLMLVTQPGKMSVMTKDGEVDAPYFVGDALLSKGEEPWCGPISRQGAIDLAERIIEGDARAKTHPLALLTLATAIAAFVPVTIDGDAEPPGTEPQSQQEGAVAHG